MTPNYRSARLPPGALPQSGEGGCPSAPPGPGRPDAFSPLLEPGTVERMDPRGKVERWRTWLAPDSGFVTMVAELSGESIGHTTVAGNELVHLFVNPDHWGRGLGRRLLDVGERLLRDGGHREVELHTRVGNARAIALYRSAGWTLTDRVLHIDEDGIVHDEHVLTKRLT